MTLYEESFSIDDKHKQLFLLGGLFVGFIGYKILTFEMAMVFYFLLGVLFLAGMNFLKGTVQVIDKTLTIRDRAGELRIPVQSITHQEIEEDLIEPRLRVTPAGTTPAMVRPMCIRALMHKGRFILISYTDAQGKNPRIRIPTTDASKFMKALEDAKKAW
ncbi:MAG: hypothetical protein WCV84_01960 [Patescibacteria group bacterium]